MAIVQLILRVLFVSFTGWFTTSLQTAERPPKIPVSTVVSSNSARPLVNPDDGGVPEAEKCSAASELHLINYENKQKLLELKALVAVTEVPEMLAEVSEQDLNYFYFLAHKLEHYTVLNVQNKLLERFCWKALQAPTRPGRRLPSVPPELRAAFIKQHGRLLLDLYDRTVLAYGVTKLEKALKKQLVPDIATLRAEWEQQQFSAATGFVETTAAVALPASNSAQLAALGIVRPVPSKPGASGFPDRR